MTWAGPDEGELLGATPFIFSSGHHGESGGPGHVFLRRELPAAKGGDHLFLEVRWRRCESGWGQPKGLVMQRGKIWGARSTHKLLAKGGPEI